MQDLVWKKKLLPELWAKPYIIKGYNHKKVGWNIFSLYLIVLYFSINLYLQLYNTGVGFCADYRPGRAIAEGSIKLSPCSDSLTQVLYTLSI